MEKSKARERIIDSLSSRGYFREYLDKEKYGFLYAMGYAYTKTLGCRDDLFFSIKIVFSSFFEDPSGCTVEIYYSLKGEEPKQASFEISMCSDENEFLSDLDRGIEELCVDSELYFQYLVSEQGCSHES